MIHYTLNTGHSRLSQRSEVADNVIEVLRPMLTIGYHAIPGTDCIVEVQTLDEMLTAVIRPAGSRIDLVQITVVDGDQQQASEVWQFVESHYLALTDGGDLAAADFASPVQPTTTPWCAVILTPLTPADLVSRDWIGDFERCLAWAWIERHKLLT